jgi:hypothetical protein
MRKLVNAFLVTSCLIVISNSVFSQQLQHPVAINSGNMNGGLDSRGRPAPDSRAWTDPALNHNRLVQQQTGDGMYQLVGNYKVVGTPFLYGEHLDADMFATEAKAYNIFISYNTYNQEISFYSTANPNVPLVREPSSVDSFIIHQNIAAGIISPLKFIYGSKLGVKDKYYFLELYSGNRFSLYKRYKSQLGYVSSNLADPNLRQYDLEYEYYYIDNQEKGMKKLKANAPTVIKEFKSVKDLTAAISNDDYSYDPEGSLRKAFTLLNN